MKKLQLTHHLKRYALSAFTVVALGAGTLALPAAAQEDIRFISDVLYVPLRAGQGNEYRIINARLKSGAKLFFLEEGDTGEWTRVRTEGGAEGWVRNQYLSSEEPSRLKLHRALGQVATLTKTNKALKIENNKLKAANTELNSEASTASKQKSAMAAELQSIKNLSAGAIELEQRYTELLEKHQLLQTENDVLSAENEKLRNDNRVNFMLYGVGILLLGVILAYLIPALKPKKRYSDWS